MTPTCTCAVARPREADVVNEEIRALARRAPLDEDEGQELARLWTEWHAAQARETVAPAA